MKDWKNIIWLLLLISSHLGFFDFAVSYWIFYVVLFLSSLTILSTKQKKIDVNGGIAGAFILFTGLIVYLLFQGNIYGTHLIYTLLSCWLLFFIWITLFNQDRNKIKIIAGIFVFTCIAELVLGFAQLFGWSNSKNEYFVLGGSFSNPGIYAGYLSIVSPMILALLLTYKRIKKAVNICYVLVACLLFIAYMLIISQSRGAWLACGLGCGLVVANHYSLSPKIKNLLHSTTRKIVAIVCVAILVCSVSYALYQFKADSAFGRILVWKIALSFPSTLFGNGIGFFEADYGKQQAAYFASGKGIEAEQYVADFVGCAYNEFLEMHIEQGIFALVLFIYILFAAFHRRKRGNSTSFIGAQASIAAVIVLMFVSFPLKILAIYMYLMFCLAVVFYAQKGNTQLSVRWLKIKLPIIAFLIAIAGMYYTCGSHLLRKGQVQVFRGQLDKGIKMYEKAEPILKNNGLFHFYYGSALSMKQEHRMAVNQLEISVKKSSNPNSFMLLGNTYKELGQFDKAKANYLMAINMAPSKLYPQYLLVNLLIENQEKEMAQVWANRILKTKEKVPTTAAREIKSEMKEFLKNSE